MECNATRCEKLFALLIDVHSLVGNEKTDSEAVCREVVFSTLWLPPVKIGKDKRVRIKVKLQVEGGEVLEESAVEYFHGAGNMLVGLEEELDGLEVGAKKKGVIPAAKAFGGPAHQHEKKIPRDEFPKETKLEVGTSFLAGSGNSEVLIEIVKIGDDEIEALLKHPLSAKNILFEAEVLAISDPSPPPLPSDALTQE